MVQSTQERVFSLVDTFFQQFMDYKFNEKFGPGWFEEQLIPYIRSYVESRENKDNKNYEKYKAFLYKNSGICRKQDIDVSFACSVLLFEKNYFFDFDQNISGILNNLRINRNEYKHATKQDDIKKISLISSTIVDLKNAVNLAGPHIFSKDFIKEIESIEHGMIGDPSNGSNNKSQEKTVFEQEYDRAEMLFRDNNYSNGFAIHMELAGNGYVQSIIRMGELYQTGYGVEQDFDRAIDWYEKAGNNERAIDSIKTIKELKRIIQKAIEGDVQSQFILGLSYEEGKGIAPDIEKAIEWYERSMCQGGILAKNRIMVLAENNQLSARYVLGNCYETGSVFEKDIEGAIEQYIKMIEADPQNQKAWNRISELAGQDEPVAQFELGQLYERGNVVEQDYLEAAKWYEKAASLGHEKAMDIVGSIYKLAANQGYEQAQLYLAHMYEEGQWVKQDYNEAVYWYRRAAEQGNPETQYAMGLIYAEGKLVRQYYREAARWYYKAAKQGHELALFNLVSLHEKNIFVFEDKKEAARLYRLAAEKGDPLAQYKIGTNYEKGQEVEKDRAEAVKWYIKAAKQGHNQAMLCLGRMYVAGLGIEQDYIEGAKWYRLLAEQGDKEAQYNLAQIYEKGPKPQQNYEEAFKWYQLAAEQNNKDAAYNLAKMYDEGQGVQQNYNESAIWYIRAAETGVPEAQYIIAQRYENGLGVEKDYAKAVAWYEKAARNYHVKAKQYLEVISKKEGAKQGYKKDQYALGRIYENGLGVNKNRKQAVKWYRSAAEQGHAEAQYSLGSMYENGLGVKQDYNQGINWYLKAAKQGNTSAQSRLDAISEKAAMLGNANACYNFADMYEKGRGVKQDYMEAVKWYVKAADQGSSDSQYCLGRIYENGLGVESDYEKAYNWYLKAADQGCGNSQYCIGRMYEEGLWVKKDYEKAASWYMLASKSDISEAHYCLGRMYENGLGVEKDPKEALSFYSKAAKCGNKEADKRTYIINKGLAEQGDANAQYKLASMYEGGLGTKKDLFHAIKWYQRAKNNGYQAARKNIESIYNAVMELQHADIQCCIGGMYERGLDVEQDYKEALRWYSLASKWGHAEAQYCLGRMYENGLGVKKDPEEALSWYEKAVENGYQKANQCLFSIYEKKAEQGFSQAQYKLAKMYENGQWVKKSYYLAMKWYCKAADFGHYEAKICFTNLRKEAEKNEHRDIQVALGRICEENLGPTKGDKYALSWYQKAAEQGNPEAEYLLGAMYRYGRCVKKDYRKAVKWYRKAEAQGYEAASLSIKILKSDLKIRLITLGL